jgi:hypothetical protein
MDSQDTELIQKYAQLCPHALKNGVKALMYFPLRKR